MFEDIMMTWRFEMNGILFFIDGTLNTSSWYRMLPCEVKLPKYFSHLFKHVVQDGFPYFSKQTGVSLCTYHALKKSCRSEKFVTAERRRTDEPGLWVSKVWKQAFLWFITQRSQCNDNSWWSHSADRGTGRKNNFVNSEKIWTSATLV